MEHIRITSHTPKYCKKVKCHQLPKTWNSAVECADELKVCVTTVYNACNGVTNGVRIKGTNKFLRLCYEEDYATCQSMADAELRVKNAENKKLKEALEAATADALKWREYQARLEAERIAEEKRLETERRAEEARQRRCADVREQLAKAETHAARARDEVECATAKCNKWSLRIAELTAELEKLEGGATL